MSEVPVQISKEVLKGLNPKVKYLVQVQKGGCSVHIYNSTLAERADMFILDITTGRPETVKVQGGEVTESIILKDKTFHVDPSLKVVLDEIAKDYESIQSRLRVMEEVETENAALIKEKGELNEEIDTLTREKEELIASPEAKEKVKYRITEVDPGWYHVVDESGVAMNEKGLRKKDALKLIKKLESE